MLFRSVRVITEKQEQSDEGQQIEHLRDNIESLREKRDRLKAMVDMSERLFTAIDTDIESLKKALEIINSKTDEN